MHDDVVEFALLLMRWKKRTDRSYAALARRLGMTSSTLHRYCTGEAVPLDFAGIERFAALCGASPEERAQLHRRWLLAVAARQRPRLSDARRAPAPDGTTGTAAAAASPSPGSPPDEEPEPMPPSLPRPGPASPGGPGPRPGRPRRRPVRAMALAASLAVALAGLTASAAGPPSGGGGSSASARTAPEPSAWATQSGNGPRKSRASAGAVPPSASAPTATPQPSASATRSGNGPQENRTDAGTAPLPAPLTWTANSQVWGELECDHDYVIDKPPQQVPPPPNPADAAPWAASQGAVHGRDTNVRITVQGRGSAAVVLEAMHVSVVSRTVPADRRGIAYSTADGCGATLQPRYFSVNLDAHRPLPRAVPAGRPDSPSFAVDFPYRVSLQEPEVLLVSAGTESCTCDWYLDLDWSSQGRRGTLRIDDHGRPFRTTSIEGLPHYWYRSPVGWVPMTTADDGAETGG
ncbi:helix-turn-helix transcriptional regulator [Streptomyces sp. NBC_01334]|nr:helix-turn-helix transcriptional regulator [Streptomyces sp. NBC_01334]WSN45220.1 helix-turn-helix transcriptional regulator [Streptomyces sp. NBC_01334]